MCTSNLALQLAISVPLNILSFTKIYLRGLVFAFVFGLQQSLVLNSSRIIFGSTL